MSIAKGRSGGLCGLLACATVLGAAPAARPAVVGGADLTPVLGEHGAFETAIGDAVLQRATAARTTPVPILMYHVIARAPSDAAYPDLFVPRARFAGHMRYLARHRYHVVTLEEVWRHWRGRRALPRKPVVISLDDGFKSWYTNAYPILRKRGWAGTMNLALSHLNGIDVRVRWVRKLLAAGWELDSHSLTHPDLTGLSESALRREVAGSRARLRRRFDVPVNFFCYPSGRYDARVIAAVREAGYVGATTTVEGFAVPSERFALKRIRVNGDDGPADLAGKLTRSTS